MNYVNHMTPLHNFFPHDRIWFNQNTLLNPSPPQPLQTTTKHLHISHHISPLHTTLSNPSTISHHTTTKHLHISHHISPLRTTLPNSFITSHHTILPQNISPSHHSITNHLYAILIMQHSNNYLICKSISLIQTIPPDRCVKSKASWSTKITAGDTKDADLKRLSRTTSPSWPSTSRSSSTPSCSQPAYPPNPSFTKRPRLSSSAASASATSTRSATNTRNF